MSDLDRANAIIEDHRRGLHDDYDTELGCKYPGCDEAFWLLTAATVPDEENPWQL